MTILFIASAWIWGVYACFKKPFIFSPIAECMEGHGLPKWIQKPFYNCPVCMASVHGTLWYVNQADGNYSIIGWVTFCVAIAGINFIIKEHLYPELS